MKKKIIKVNYILLFFLYNFYKRFLKKTDYIVGKILKYNNQRFLEVVKKSELSKKNKILIILPHCVQGIKCRIRVTNELENCLKCGGCNLGGLLELKEKYPQLYIKIAPGGTVARKYIKEIKPNFVIAIACERDLMSGIFDSVPLPVYGIKNKIVTSECLGTDFSIFEVEKVLKLMNI